jgi:hypothetical protein
LIVVVGGQSRKAGKTRAVCDIIRATVEAQWTAIKITSHGHGIDLNQPTVHEEAVANNETDTGRYLCAGAVRAVWLRARFEDLRHALQDRLEGNIIIESNTVLDILEPDLFVFITDSGITEWKESAQRRFPAESITVDRVISRDVIERVKALIESKQ